MRAIPLLVAAMLTLSYGFVTQAAIAADLDPTVVGRARAVADPERVWFGGTLAPITVEASAEPAGARGIGDASGSDRRPPPGLPAGRIV